jgi:hypothetical protein
MAFLTLKIADEYPQDVAGGRQSRSSASPDAEPAGGRPGRADGGAALVSAGANIAIARSRSRL